MAITINTTITDYFTSAQRPIEINVSSDNTDTSLSIEYDIYLKKINASSYDKFAFVQPRTGTTTGGDAEFVFDVAKKCLDYLTSDKATLTPVNNFQVEKAEDNSICDCYIEIYERYNDSNNIPTRDAATLQTFASFYTVSTCQQWNEIQSLYTDCRIMSNTLIGSSVFKFLTNSPPTQSIREFENIQISLLHSDTYGTTTNKVAVIKLHDGFNHNFTGSGTLFTEVHSPYYKISGATNPTGLNQKYCRAGSYNGAYYYVSELFDYVIFFSATLQASKWVFCAGIVPDEIATDYAYKTLIVGAGSVTNVGSFTGTISTAFVTFDKRNIIDIIANTWTDIYGYSNSINRCDYIEVYVQTFSGTVISEVKRYNVDYSALSNHFRVHFFNYKAGYDQYTFNGFYTEIDKHSKSVAQVQLPVSFTSENGNSRILSSVGKKSVVVQGAFTSVLTERMLSELVGNTLVYLEDMTNHIFIKILGVTDVKEIYQSQQLLNFAYEFYYDNNILIPNAE